MRYRCASPEKSARVEGYMQSHGMRKTLNYQDNDPTHGLVSVKSEIKVYIPPDNKNKDVWKPKTSL